MTIRHFSIVILKDSELEITNNPYCPQAWYLWCCLVDVVRHLSHQSQGWLLCWYCTKLSCYLSLSSLQPATNPAQYWSLPLMFMQIASKLPKLYPNSVLLATHYKYININYYKISYPNMFICKTGYFLAREQSQHSFFSAKYFYSR